MRAVTVIGKSDVMFIVSIAIEIIDKAFFLHYVSDVDV